MISDQYSRPELWAISLFAKERTRCMIVTDYDTNLYFVEPPCLSVTCANGGTCDETDGSCECVDGYTGETCDSRKYATSVLPHRVCFNV